MTDDTRDRDRPFVDAGESPETASDGNAERSPAFERADHASTGTAEATRSPTERTTVTEPNDDRLEERLRAVERALTGTDDAVADIGDEAAASAEREELSTRLDELEARIEELEAATQAIRGYVGSIRAVNKAVERRADLALAKASENGGETADGNTLSGGETGGDSEGVPDCETSPGSDAATNDNALDVGVPSEDALDAAVPADRRRGNEMEPTSGSAVDCNETSGEKADNSWRTGALDRLRDSL